MKEHPAFQPRAHNTHLFFSPYVSQGLCKPTWRSRLLQAHISEHLTVFAHESAIDDLDLPTYSAYLHTSNIKIPGGVIAV